MNDTGLVAPDGTPAQSYAPPTNGEVMAEASKKCKTCKGAGNYRQWIPLKDPCPAKGQPLHLCGRHCEGEVNTMVRVPRVCACAVRRWEKRHGKDILTGKPKVEA